MTSTQREYQRNKGAYFRRSEKSYAKSRSCPEERLKRMLVEAKSRAKARSIVFDIIVDDVQWNNICPVLNIPIVINNKGKGGLDNSPALDRINNDKGYVKGNVRIISNRANKLKNDATKEEVKLLLENWEKVLSI